MFFGIFRPKMITRMRREVFPPSIKSLHCRFWQCNVNMLRKLILSVRYRTEKETFTKKIAIIVHNMETRKMILKSLGNLYHQSFVNRSKKEYDIPYSSKIGKKQHGKVACVNGKQIHTKARDGDMLTILIGNARHFTHLLGYHRK